MDTNGLPSLFCLAAGLPGVAMAGDAAGVVDERPNILFITTDYTRGADLPVADLPWTGGAMFLQAPTLTRLCAEGAVFARHSCGAPICMPSRATIAAGSYPHTHGLWDNRHIPVKKAVRPFLVTDLGKQGYQTLGIGKMHWYPHQEDYGYDVRISLEGKDLHHCDDDYEGYLAQHGWRRKKIQPLKGSGGIPPGQSYVDWPLDENLHPDAYVGIKTLETLQRGGLSKTRPWFMWVSFTGPHNPWNAPKLRPSWHWPVKRSPWHRKEKAWSTCFIPVPRRGTISLSWSARW